MEGESAGVAELVLKTSRSLNREWISSIPSFLQMSKILEHSNDTKIWKPIGVVEDSDFQKKWAELQQWIKEEQPYGFFRAIDDSRSVEEIIDQLGK